MYRRVRVHANACVRSCLRLCVRVSGSVRARVLTWVEIWGVSVYMYCELFLIFRFIIRTTYNCTTIPTSTSTGCRYL